MALKPEAYFGVTDYATIEISQESFRSVIGQIESELLCSDTYSHALASLQTMLGEAASAAEILIRAVSREAVKLAFQRFPKQNKIQLQAAPQSFAAESPVAEAVRELEPPVPEPVCAESPAAEAVRELEPPVPEPVCAESPAAEAVRELEPPVPEPVFYWRSAAVEAPPEIKSDTENSDTEKFDRDTDTSKENEQPPEDKAQVESAAPATVVVPQKSFLGFGFPKRQKKLTKEETAAIAIQHRKDCLCELGRELRKGRQIRSLSLQQLHSQTFVPLHHLEAIENGEIEKLPQDIYLRGFIRRIGDALGLNGQAMADALPLPDPSETAHPYLLSTSDSESDSEFQMRPVHLYIGYTALMAGAVGGVAWLSQQPVVPANAAPQIPATPPSVAPAQQREAPTPRPGLKKSRSHGGMIMGADMAPPEVIFG
jgi:cytoskeleton protein RodZ